LAIFYNSRTITDGLVLALDAGNLKSYPGSGTTWTDIIGRGNTGTLTNSPPYTYSSPTYSSQNGGSIVFNGVNNYVENLSPNLGISGDTSVTLSCWFYNSVNSSDNQALLVYGNGSTGGDSISILLQSLTFYASFNGGLDAVIADNVYALNTWNNVVVTKTPGAINTTTKLYLNGVEQTITSASSSTPSLSSRVVRVARWTADATPYYFLGGVSAALIYNRALSAAEVLQNYNSLKNRFVTAPVLIPVKPPYQISRSLRFNSADSAYLNRTPSVAGNRKTWTWAGWVKLAKTSFNNLIECVGPTTPGTRTSFMINNLDKIDFFTNNTSTSRITTTQVFRDYSSWYHIVLAVDTTQATASDRVKLYVNNSRVTTFTTATYPSQNLDTQINNTQFHTIGRVYDPFYANMYVADVHFVDGQALTPSSFTETNSNTGQLVPKFYSGTYGTNGFRLDFSDNSAATAATLGADSSGAVGIGISAATGALPIYNTTDTYGAVKGTGTRTDSNASSLVLAIPMDGANNGTTFTDESATIRGSGSAKAITRSGAITSTAQSKFYGSSGRFNGGSVNLATDLSTDFAFLTSNYTIEFWFNKSATGEIPGFETFLDARPIDTTDSPVFGMTGSQLTSYGFPAGNGQVNYGTTIANNTWYHLAAVKNGTNHSIYLNGVLEYTTTSASNPTSNPSKITIGRSNSAVAGNYNFNGYIQDLRVYKGVAKYTSNFTPPLGPNNWTPNNLSVTAGAGNDSLTDTPTSYGTDTGDGGEVRGNYCTWNPNSSRISTLSNGNITVASAGGNADSRCNATIAVSSGKWYYEIALNGVGTNSSAGIGQNQITTLWPGNDSLSYAFELDNARTAHSLNLVAYGSALGSGDVFMCAFDLDNNKIYFGKNGTWFNSSNPVTGANPAFTITSGTYTPIARPYKANTTGVSFDTNFGQRPFAYAAPSGFKELCDTNLPAPTIAKGSSVFDTKLYTGNGSTQTISGLDFSPDLVWVKSRSNSAWWHILTDTVRGAGNYLSSNSTGAEAGGGTSLVNGFTSDGFNLNMIPNGTVNNNADTYVAWAWDAGSSTVTNTSGSITSQVRANPSAGFSIVSWTATGSVSTVGHGLNAKPSLCINKPRTGSYGGGFAADWAVVTDILNGSMQYLYLNSTQAVNNTGWGSSPTSSVKSAYSYSAGLTMISYCFAPVTGYSSFGSYTGNGSADGSFTYLGFLPKLILIKRTNTTSNWTMLDTLREGYNVDNDPLYPNLAGGEGTTDLLDINSNGFKLRTTDASVNANGGTYIYAAWASNPFQYSRAR
jgi:hypothetical protein